MTDSVSAAGCPKHQGTEPSRWQRIKKWVRGWLFGGETKPIEYYFAKYGLIFLWSGVLITGLSFVLLLSIPISYSVFPLSVLYCGLLFFVIGGVLCAVVAAFGEESG